MMNTVERISVVIPKFKQQLIFLEEREKLFKKINDCSIELCNSSFSIATNSQPSPIVPTNSQSSSVISPGSQSSSIIPPNSQVLSLEPRSTPDVLPKATIDRSSSEPSVVEEKIYESFPNDYVIPTLPDSLLNDIEKGNLNSFGPHCANRQILIDVISYDLIDKFNLLYPSHTQFDNIGTTIVKLLRLPVNKQNITIWKDALQTKLKRRRTEHRDNNIVQEYQLKYSRSSSGRPVKRQHGETAQRDRYKQMVVVSFDNELSNEIQTKSDQLRVTTDIDISTQLELWKETLPYRRKCVRDQSTTDILHDFPGYSNAIFIFEEVKMLTKIDLSIAIRRQIPVLLDKIVKTPMFVTDSLPIQLIKTLCRQFDETIQHVFSDTEPFTPYPCLVCLNDLIDVYVDFKLIVSTNSPDDALALLITMYTIFELSFNKKSRTVRFLYSVLHSDKRFLSNSIRIFINENNIDIYSEQKQSSLTSSDHVSSASTTIMDDPHSDAEVAEQYEPSNEHDLSIDNQRSEENDSIHIVDSSSRTLNNTNECDNLVEVALSQSELSSQQRKTQQRTARQSTTQQPTVQQPATQQRTTQQLTTQQLTTQQLTTQQPTTQQPTTQQPTAQQRKRQRINQSVDIDNNTCSTDVEQSQQQIQSQNNNPLTDVTNTSSTSRQIKRKRRI